MITDMISTAPGFQTSVNISYDLNNPDKIRGLIPTTAAIDLFEDFLLSTDNASTNRARILILLIEQQTQERTLLGLLMLILLRIHIIFRLFCRIFAKCDSFILTQRNISPIMIMSF